MAGRTSAAAASMASVTRDLNGLARAEQRHRDRTGIRRRDRSRRSFCRGLRGCHAGLEPPNRAHDRAGLGAAGVVDRRRLPREPGARLGARKPELSRHHADDRVLHAVEHDRLPNDVVAQTEALFPQAVRDQGQTAGRCRRRPSVASKIRPRTGRTPSSSIVDGVTTRHRNPRRLAGPGEGRLVFVAVIRRSPRVSAARRPRRCSCRSSSCPGRVPGGRRESR